MQTQRSCWPPFMSVARARTNQTVADPKRTLVKAIETYTDSASPLQIFLLPPSLPLPRDLVLYLGSRSCKNRAWFKIFKSEE